MRPEQAAGELVGDLAQHQNRAGQYQRWQPAHPNQQLPADQYRDQQPQREQPIGRGMLSPSRPSVVFGGERWLARGGRWRGSEPLVGHQALPSSSMARRRSRQRWMKSAP